MGQSPLLPDARKDRLLIERLDDETVVYDLERDRAHCLNRAARSVWASCDGRTSVSDAAERLAAEVGLPPDESLVYMALARLEKARLLSERLDSRITSAALSRREVIRTLGLTGALVLLLPAVESVVAPLAAQAASCTPLALCESLDKNSCTGLPICENRNTCCRRRGQFCVARNC